MKEHIFPAVKLTLICLLFFSGIYTLIVLGMAQFVPGKGKGETFSYHNKKFYTNIGQKFTYDRYFNSRPSAVDYNAAGSAGSNKSPYNPAYLEMVQQRIDSFLVHNPGIQKADIPSDLVTASGSGLDPHISVEAAQVQVKRIAAIRGIAEGNLEQLILSHTDKPLMGFLGTARVNVLKLNIALDNLK